MKPLVTLLVVFLLSLLITLIVYGEAAVPLSGRIALAAMLLLTAVGHFKFTKGMMLMLPPFLRWKKSIVIFTGLLEMAAAAGILIAATQRITGICLFIFFILILPANIYAAKKNVDFETGNYDGSGMRYLWFRIPLQLFSRLGVLVCCKNLITLIATKARRH